MSIQWGVNSKNKFELSQPKFYTNLKSQYLNYVNGLVIALSSNYNFFDHPSKDQQERIQKMLTSKDNLKKNTKI